MSAGSVGPGIPRGFPQNMEELPDADPERCLAGDGRARDLAGLRDVAGKRGLCIAGRAADTRPPPPLPSRPPWPTASSIRPYGNLFGRAATLAELSLWSSQFFDGTVAFSALVYDIASFATADADILAMNSKIQAASYFTTAAARVRAAALAGSDEGRRQRRHQSHDGARVGGGDRPPGRLDAYPDRLSDDPATDRHHDGRQGRSRWRRHPDGQSGHPGDAGHAGLSLSRPAEQYPGRHGPSAGSDIRWPERYDVDLLRARYGDFHARYRPRQRPRGRQLSVSGEPARRLQSRHDVPRSRRRCWRHLDPDRCAVERRQRGRRGDHRHHRREHDPPQHPGRPGRRQLRSCRAGRHGAARQRLHLQHRDTAIHVDGHRRQLRQPDDAVRHLAERCRQHLLHARRRHQGRHRGQCRASCSSTTSRPAYSPT